MDEWDIHVDVAKIIYHILTKWLMNDKVIIKINAKEEYDCEQYKWYEIFKYSGAKSIVVL